MVDRGGHFCRPSATAGALEDDAQGSQKNFNVEPKTPVVDVVQLEAHHLVEIADVVAAAHLLQSGDAGVDADPAALPVLIMTHLIRSGRAGSHQAHLTAQDVPELGKFVETGAGVVAPAADRSQNQAQSHLLQGQKQESDQDEGEIEEAADPLGLEKKIRAAPVIPARRWTLMRAVMIW